MQIEYKQRKGFTLIEILLVIALMGILLTTVLVAINPSRQLAQVRNAQRQSHMQALQKALDFYATKNEGSYPPGVTSSYQDVCNTGTEIVGGVTNCTGKLDLRILVPTYIVGIPKDSQAIGTSSGYSVALNSSNNGISLTSDKAELGSTIAINKIIQSSYSGYIDSSLDSDKPVGFDNAVNVVLQQSNGKLIVGGYFTSYKGVPANSIIRLNSDGSIDNTFNVGTGFDSGISTVVRQSDGKFVIGGQFGNYQGVSATRIIRLNSDGSRDNTFNMGTGFASNYFDGAVTNILLQSDGKLVVAGYFWTYQGVSANGIIRLNSDGSRDNTFNMGTGFDSGTNSIILQNDGKVLVTGSEFTSYQGVSASRIIRLNSNGSRDNTFNMGAGFDNYVTKVIQQSDGKFVIGGGFTTYQGVSANRIIRLNSDGSRDNTFNIGTGFNGNGTFSGFWDGGISSIVQQSDGKLVIGGGFTSYQGVSSGTSIIRLNSDGSRDNTFNIGTGIDTYVRIVMQQSDGQIIVGGDFTTYKEVPANKIIRLNSDGSRDSSFNIGLGLNGAVNTVIQQSDGKLVIGGAFTGYREVSSKRIMRLNSDGSRDSSFNIGTGFDGGDVYIVVQQSDGKLMVGGYFSSYQGSSANNIIRLNADGTRDNTFNVGTGFSCACGSGVGSIVQQASGKLIVVGSFTTYQGGSVTNIIRLNSDGSRDNTFNVHAGLNAGAQQIIQQSDGKLIVVGLFTQYLGVSANKIIRLNSDGSRDNTFNVGTGFDSGISTLMQQNDGKLVIAGNFSTYQELAVNVIIRLNSDGSRDSGFNFVSSPLNSTLMTIAQQSDGKLVMGGSFSGSQGNRIMRLNSNGSIDNTFNTGTGFNPEDTIGWNWVSSIIKQSDGQLVVGGTFTNYKNQPAGYLIRLNP